MRKSIIAAEAGTATEAARVGSLNITELARVEVTSEDPQFPIEDVFADGNEGWRASLPGEHTLRLVFDAPVDVSRVALTFEERDTERTQELVLRWRRTGGEWREIVRQQWNFSPNGSTAEQEAWDLKLEQLGELELQIRPDINGGPAKASLRRWTVA